VEAPKELWNPEHRRLRIWLSAGLAGRESCEESFFPSSYIRCIISFVWHESRQSCGRGL
jgi:hypothetical protein